MMQEHLQLPVQLEAGNASDSDDTPDVEELETETIKVEVKDVNFLSFYQHKELSDRTLLLIECPIEGDILGGDFLRPGDASLDESSPSSLRDEIVVDSDNENEEVEASRPGSKRSLGKGDDSSSKSGPSTRYAKKARQDCTQNVKKEHRLPIHSIVFCANSDYFKKMLLSTDLKESNEQEVKVYLETGELDTFLTMAKLFYRREEFTCNDLVENNSSMQEFIDLLHLADKFLCNQLISYLQSIFVKFSITKIETLNLLVDFLLKVGTPGMYLYRSYKIWMDPCLRFLMTNYFPLEKMLVVDLKDFINDCTVDTIEFVLKHGRDAVISENSLLTMCMLAAELKQCTSDEVSRLLTACKLDKINDAKFIANAVSFSNPYFKVWDGFASWYTQTLERVVINSSLKLQNERYTRRHQNFLDLTRHWPIVKFVLDRQLNLDIDDDQRIMRTDKVDSAQILGSGYLFKVISVLLKKGRDRGRHFAVSFDVEIMNILTTIHSPLKLSFRCCPRALGGGPSKNEHPWDSIVEVPPHTTKFTTTPFTMTSTRPISFSQFQNMYFHILITCTNAPLTT